MLIFLAQVIGKLVKEAFCTMESVCVGKAVWVWDSFLVSMSGNFISEVLCHQHGRLTQELALLMGALDTHARGTWVLQELQGHQLSMSAMDEEESLDADSAEGTTGHRHSASNSHSRAGLSEAGATAVARHPSLPL